MSGTGVTDDHPTMPVETTSPRGFALGLLLGLPLIAYGIGGAIVDADDTHPGELASWFIRLAIIHDVIIAPTVLALGWLTSRLARDDRIRRTLRAALLTSAGLCLVGYPFVRGFGRSDAVPSALARNYGVGLAIYLVIVWLVTAAIASGSTGRLRRGWRQLRGQRRAGGPRCAAARRGSRPTLGIVGRWVRRAGPGQRR
jgi:hypothetical protein